MGKLANIINEMKGKNMEVLNFIKNYWTQIAFLISMLGAFFVFALNMIQATKCSLRNDILTIYDRCKDTKKITHYQLESLEHSAELYYKLRGNSFVKSLMERVKNFEIVD